MRLSCHSLLTAVHCPEQPAGPLHHSTRLLCFKPPLRPWHIKPFALSPSLTKPHSEQAEFLPFCGPWHCRLLPGAISWDLCVTELFSIRHLFKCHLLWEAFPNPQPKPWPHPSLDLWATLIYSRTLIILQIFSFVHLFIVYFTSLENRLLRGWRPFLSCTSYILRF